MEKYEEEDAGLLNKISHFFETSGKQELRYIKNIEEAFERNKEDFANGFIKSIGYTIQQSTPRIMQNKIKNFFNSEVNNNDSNTNLPDRIAVSDDSLLPKNFKHHLSILFNPNLQFNQEDLRGVEDTVKFLPLTIYLFALNEFQKRCQLNDIEIPRKTEGNLQLNNVFSQFSNFLKEQGALSKILMAAFAIDVADGEMNSIPKLLTGLGLSLGAANIATVATVAVGFIYIALMETKNLDLERRSDIKKSVDHIIDVYKEKITDTFDEINQILRETLLSNLEAFYKIDDNLALTVAGVVGDAEYIVKILRAQNEAYKMEENNSLNPTSATSLLHLILQENKMMPFIVQLIVGGLNKNVPELYSMDPYGGFTKESKFTSTGSGSPTALGYLEDIYKKESTTQEVVKGVAKALKIAMKRDSATGDRLTIVSITKSGYKEYTSEEIEKLLK